VNVGAQPPDIGEIVKPSTSVYESPRSAGTSSKPSRLIKAASVNPASSRVAASPFPLLAPEPQGEDVSPDEDALLGPDPLAPELDEPVDGEEEEVFPEATTPAELCPPGPGKAEGVLAMSTSPVHASARLVPHIKAIRALMSMHPLDSP
jgi:hypothetical protein